MYKVRFSEGKAEFTFRNYDDAINFISMALEAGDIDGMPVIATIYLDDVNRGRGLF